MARAQPRVPTTARFLLTATTTTAVVKAAAAAATTVGRLALFVTAAGYGTDSPFSHQQIQNAGRRQRGVDDDGGDDDLPDAQRRRHSRHYS